MWEIEYYEDEGGNCPLVDYLDSLHEEKELPYAVNAIERVKEHGHNLRRPHAAYLRDKIYELRFRINRNQHRILYFFFYQEKIVLTHGFYKSESAVDPKEIDRAIGYREKYLAHM